MTNAITPSPWRVRRTSSDTFAVLGAMQHKPGHSIAVVNTENDARLIAAAPALLAALHAVLDDIDADRAAGIEPPDWYWVACEAAALAAPDDIDEAAEQERNQYAHDDR